MRTEIGLEKAILPTQRSTRRYAKRQISWFPRERDMERLCRFGDDPAIQGEELERVRARAFMERR